MIPKIPKKKKVRIKEGPIELAIGHYLRVNRFCFWKQNTRGFFDGKNFRKDFNPYAMTGLPDYVIIYRGFHQALEVKSPDNDQTENQIEFEKYITTMGGARYDVVKSLEEGIKVINEFKEFVDRLYGDTLKTLQPS